MPAIWPDSDRTKVLFLDPIFTTPRKLSFQAAMWSVSQAMA
jgi:hypothetical protein